ncbi:hypothetical protein [Salibacterium aidingense]|uniref:hypothetical protein n=2 Tax=Salibacterium aidingense TaxID=384933 RepID=UPI003BE9BAAD
MKHTYLGVLAFSAVFLYLISVFYSPLWMETAYSGIAALLLFFSLFRMRTLNRIVVGLLLLIGSSLFLYYNTSFSNVLQSFGENLNLIGLFLLIPFLGILMSEAGYLQALQAFFLEREKNRPSHPYRTGYLLTASMGSILNLGSMPLVYNIGYESFSTFENKTFGLTLLRGFGFCMLWSPYFVNVGLILILYDLSWSQIGGYGLLLAVLYTIIVWCFFRFTRFSREEWISNKQPVLQSRAAIKHSLHRLLAYIIILLLLSFLLELSLPINMLTSVSITALLYPLLWAGCTGLFQPYVQGGVQHVLSSFDRLYNEIGIFITAGFFGEALSLSQAGEWLSVVMMKGSHGIIPILILLLIGTAMLLAFVGIHPVIIVLGLGSSLNPEQFGVHPPFMGLLLLTAWMIAVQISPFSGSVLMASNLMKVSPWKVIQKNAVFIGSLTIVMTIVLSIIHWLSL